MKRLRLAIAMVALAAIVPFSSSVHGASPVAAPSGLKASGSLTIGTNFGYPPMEEFSGANANVPSGADIDLGRALATKMGLKANFLNITDFGTIIIGLQQHKFDVIMSSMNVTSARAKQVNFVPYLLAGQSIVVKKGNPKHISTLADLSGQAVSIQAGTTEVDAANIASAALKKQGKPGITIKTYQQDTTALQQVALGRVTAELTDFPVAVYDSTKFPSQFQIAGKQYAALPYGIAIRKSDPSILKAVTAAFKLVVKDGEYMTILKKYHLEQGAISH
jgi:polar amino acid transport system substrate-binding protein